jgi:hypothetical protein
MTGPLRRGADIGSGPTYPVVFTGCTPPYSNSAMCPLSQPRCRGGYFFHPPIIDELLSPVIGEAVRFRSPLSACSASLSSCLRSASKLALAAESFVAAALIAHLRANCRRYSGRALMQHATSAGLSSETGTALPFHCGAKRATCLAHSPRTGITKRGLLCFKPWIEKACGPAHDLSQDHSGKRQSAAADLLPALRFADLFHHAGRGAAGVLHGARRYPAPARPIRAAAAELVPLGAALGDTSRRSYFDKHPIIGMGRPTRRSSHEPFEG